LELNQSYREKQAAERKCRNEADDLVHVTAPVFVRPLVQNGIMRLSIVPEQTSLLFLSCAVQHNEKYIIINF
jgi:hypothetical protein